MANYQDLLGTSNTSDALSIDPFTEINLSTSGTYWLPEGYVCLVYPTGTPIPTIIPTITPTPSPTFPPLSPSPTPTSSPFPTPSPSITPSPTGTFTGTPTVTQSLTPTPTPNPRPTYWVGEDLVCVQTLITPTQTPYPTASGQPCPINGFPTGKMYCQNNHLFIEYHNGTCGVYVVDMGIKPDQCCGDDERIWLPENWACIQNVYPPVGTPIESWCEGTSLFVKYHNGQGGFYITEHTNSAICCPVPTITPSSTPAPTTTPTITPSPTLPSYLIPPSPPAGYCGLNINVVSDPSNYTVSDQSGIKVLTEVGRTVLANINDMLAGTRLAGQDITNDGYNTNIIRGVRIPSYQGFPSSIGYVCNNPRQFVPIAIGSFWNTQNYFRLFWFKEINNITLYGFPSMPLTDGEWANYYLRPYHYPLFEQYQTWNGTGWENPRPDAYVYRESGCVNNEYVLRLSDVPMKTLTKIDSSPAYLLSSQPEYATTLVGEPNQFNFLLDNGTQYIYEDAHIPPAYNGADSPAYIIWKKEQTVKKLSVCLGQTVTLQAQTGYAKYLWSDGQTGQTITVNKTGVYSVVAYVTDQPFDNSPCYSDSVLVEVIDCNP